VAWHTDSQSQCGSYTNRAGVPVEIGPTRMCELLVGPQRGIRSPLLANTTLSVLLRSLGRRLAERHGHSAATGTPPSPWTSHVSPRALRGRLRRDGDGSAAGCESPRSRNPRRCRQSSSSPPIGAGPFVVSAAATSRLRSSACALVPRPKQPRSWTNSLTTWPNPQRHEVRSLAGTLRR